MGNDYKKTKLSIGSTPLNCYSTERRKTNRGKRAKEEASAVLADRRTGSMTIPTALKRIFFQTFLVQALPQNLYSKPPVFRW
jgi:hypothetical protein